MNRCKATDATNVVMNHCLYVIKTECVSLSVQVHCLPGGRGTCSGVCTKFVMQTDLQSVRLYCALNVKLYDCVRGADGAGLELHHKPA